MKITAILLINAILAQKSCTNNSGSNVVKIMVHADGASLVALQTSLASEFSLDMNTLQSISKFFGGIFDMVNENLEPFGVQVHGDFSKSLLDNFKPKYDHSRCDEASPVSNRTQIALSAIKSKTPVVGNRIVLLFCPEMVNKPPKSAILTDGKCNNIAGFMFGEIRQLRDLIHEGTMQLISRSIYKSSGAVRSGFNGELCSYVGDCIANEAFGEFKKGLKSVRHLVVEKYVSKRQRAHRYYDKAERWSEISHKGHDIQVYPTNDFSNESELYSDFN